MPSSFLIPAQQRSQAARRPSVSHHFQMQNWPADTDEQKASAALMVEENSWLPQALPLYDNSGRIVNPRQYSMALPGALVVVNFTLTRHWLPDLHRFTHRANVEEVNMLDSTTVAIAIGSHAKLMARIRDD